MPLFFKPRAEKALQEAETRIAKWRKHGNPANDLNLSGLGLESIPDSLYELIDLQGLHLENNGLGALPEALGHLTALKDLRLTGNKLTTLPTSIIKLQALRGLSLAKNRFSNVPDYLGSLKALQGLSLHNNQIVSLPTGLFQLKSLQGLSLHNNDLKTLPEELGYLRALRELSLDNNHLKALPESLSRLQALERLYLFNNQLTSLPQNLGKLQMLKELYLHGNPGLGLSDEILGPTFQDVAKNRSKPCEPKSIVEYYYDTRGNKGSALRELRMIVVGHPAVGKTSVVRRLNRETLDKDESETHGIGIRPLQFKCADGDIVARVWDFGGQHVLHAMHEFFLTRRCLYLLVLEQRTDRTEHDAKYWLQLIRSYAGDAPVVVALNQSQGVLRPFARAALERDYGPILGWVPTECLPEKECSGAEKTIENLRETLTQAMNGMGSPRTLFPVKWLRIKKWLEEMKEPYLSYEEYERHSQDDEPDASKRAELAALMNDLGIALNYARDPRLRDTTVLRPDWLANGIYAILRANMLQDDRLLAPDGVITANLLPDVYAAAEAKGMLLKKDYPQEKHSFLLRLMGLFRLSFPLDDRDERHLVPTLLPPDEHPKCIEPHQKDRIRLRYDFDVVPAPLMGRFMVGLFPLMEPGNAWKRGMCLRYGRARARVWMDVDENRVFMTVGGSENDKTELLSLCRETMKRMARDYRELRMEEQVEYRGRFVPRGALEDFGVLDREECIETVGDQTLRRSEEEEQGGK